MIPKHIKMSALRKEGWSIEQLAQEWGVTYEEIEEELKIIDEYERNNQSKN